jgi:hypothetical protein
MSFFVLRLCTRLDHLLGEFVLGRLLLRARLLKRFLVQSPEFRERLLLQDNIPQSVLSP